MQHSAHASQILRGLAQFAGAPLFFFDTVNAGDNFVVVSAFSPFLFSRLAGEEERP